MTSGTTSTRSSGGILRRLVLVPVGRGLTWFPATVLVLVAAPFGLAAAATGARRRPADTRGAVGEAAPPRPMTRRRAIGSAITAFVPALVAFALALLTVYLVWAGWLYPLRPDTFEYLRQPLTPVAGLDNAWGGDTLVGAWIAHALIALAIQVCAVAGLIGLGAVRDRLAARMG